MNPKNIIPIIFIIIIFIPFTIFSQWNLERIATDGRSGCVAADSSGNVHVAYLINPYGSNAAYAVRENDKWTSTTLTSSGEVNGVALAVDTSGLPHIIYAEANPTDFNFLLKHIAYTGSGWSSPETIVETDTDLMTWGPTIQIDSDNNIHITYLLTDADAGTGIIYYVNNTSGAWESQALNSKYQNPALYDVSMKVDSEGYVHIVSYFSALGGPGYMTNAPNGQWSSTQLIQLNWYGGQLELLTIDIALDPHNNPHVSYVGSYDGSAVENHMYASKTSNTWSFQKIDDGSWSSTGNAITCDPDGVEHIAYYHVESEELRYAMNYSGSWPHETLDTPETSNNFMRRVEMVSDQNSFIHIVYEGDDDMLYATNRIELPAPNIVLSPTPLAFGTIDTGQVSIKFLQIKNEGVLDLHISDIKLKGGDSSEFFIDHSCDTIAPNDSCAVQVTFEPIIPNEKQTSLRITSNDPDTPISNVLITGRTPYPIISMEPDSLNFDPLEVGESDGLMLMIKNSGDAALTIDSIHINGDDASTFSYNSSCLTIPQSTSCNLEVFFEPEAVGTKKANLHLFSNDPNNSEIVVPLNGRTPSAHIEIQVPIVDFGTVPVGNLATKKITIKNTGERQLNISSFTISGTNASLFRSASTCGAISSGGSCSLELTFVPNSTGDKSAWLNIASNDPDQSVYSIILRGTGGENQNRAFIYSSEDDERFYCIDTLSSGDFILGGCSGQYPCIAVINPVGTILWQKYLSSGTRGDAIHAVRELWDKSLVVAGQISSRYRWIARLDSDGEILWQKRPEDDYWGNIHDVIVTADSELVAVGETWPQGPSAPDMWIGRLDSSGAMLWQKRIGKPFGGSLEPNFERGLTVLEIDNGNLIVAGGGSKLHPFNALAKHPDGGYLYGGDIAILWKISPEGDLIWQKKIDPIGGLDFWLAHISPEDAILWQKSYYLSNLSEYIYDLTLTSNGDIIALGSILSPNDNDMRIMRLTKSGGIIWQKQFTAPGHQEGFKVIAKADGSINIAGYYDPDIQNEDALLVQLNSNGNLDGCASNYLSNTDATPNSSSNNFSSISLPYTDNPDDFIEANLTISDGVLEAQNLCTGIPVDLDYDGVDDTEEAGPDGQDSNYDGNNDGLPDSQQDYVTSLHSKNDSFYVTLATNSDLKFENVSSKDNPSPQNQPPAFDFPFGFYEFTISGIDTGGSAEVKFILPENITTQTYYKFSATEENPTPHWYEFLYNGQTGAIINNNILKLYFIDKKRGDDDIAENAQIKDIGAPGIYFQLQLAELIHPPNKAANISINPVLKWAPVERADLYQIQIDREKTFSTTDFDIDSIATDSIAIQNLDSNTTYFWKVRAFTEFDTSDWSEIWEFKTITETEINPENKIPNKFELFQNYPNPFNSSTVIKYGLPINCRINIRIYDINGNLIENLLDSDQQAGWHNILWNGKDKNGIPVSSGIYFLQIYSKDFMSIKKMLLIK